MKKYIVSFFIVLVVTLVVDVSAQTTVTPKQGIRREIKEGIKELRQEVKNIPTNLRKKVAIVAGQVTSISGTTLTVTKDSKNYAVNTDGKTIFRRHFFGKSSLSEIAVGHTVQVYGSFTDDTQTTILARVIRDISIQKRRGTFFGDVVSKSTDSFVIKSINRGDQTVVVSNTTKYVSRNERPITFNDIQIGHRVRVKGLWDKALNKITEVRQVKDFSIPPRPTQTPPATP